MSEMLLLALANLGRWLTEWADGRIAARHHQHVVDDIVKAKW